MKDYSNETKLTGHINHWLFPQHPYRVPHYTKQKKIKVF